jgi:hypothetical protein
MLILKEYFIKSGAYEVENKLNRFSLLDERMDEFNFKDKR